MKQTIIDLCAAAGVPVPSAGRRRSIDLFGVYGTTREDDHLERLRSIAAKRGGRCLATEYLGSDSPVRFECAAGHRWSVRPQDVFAGSWCMKCSRIETGLRNRLTIGEMQALAAERGGVCLSTEYRGARSALEWKCGKCGNVWTATPATIKKGSWCPPCAYRDGWERRRKRFGRRGQGKG